MTDPRRYPDPLHVPGDEPTRQRLQKAYEAGVADGHRIHVLALVLMIGLGFVIGFALASGVRAAGAQSFGIAPSVAVITPPAEVRESAVGWHPYPDPVPGAIPSGAVGSGSGADGAPPPAPEPTSDGDDGGGIWGTPPPDTATDLRQGRTGTIAQAKGHGANYLAIPIGPGHLVEVCGPAACWTTVSTDGGPNHDMLVAGRIADVAVGHWIVICGVPAVLGLCDGSWHVVSAGTTPPPTDVTP